MSASPDAEAAAKFMDELDRLTSLLMNEFCNKSAQQGAYQSLPHWTQNLPMKFDAMERNLGRAAGQTDERTEVELTRLQNVDDKNRLLRCEIDRTTGELESLKAHTDRLEKEVELMSNENRLLGDQLEELKIQRQESDKTAREALGKERKQLEDLRTAYRLQQSALSDNAKLLKTRSDELEQQKSTIDELTAANRKMGKGTKLLVSEREQLKVNLKVLEAKLHAESISMQKCVTAKRSMELELESQSKACADLESARSSLQEENHKLSQQNQLLQIQMENLTRRAKEAEEASITRVQALESKVTSLGESLRAKDDLMTQLQNKIATLESQIHRGNAERKQMQDMGVMQQRKLTCQLQDALRRSELILQEKARIELTVTHLKGRLNLQADEFNERLTEAKRSQDQLLRQLCEQSKQLQSTKRQLADKVQCLSDLEKEVVLAFAELLVTEAKIECDSPAEKDAVAQLRQVQEELIQTKSALVAADKELAALSAEQDEVRQKVGSLLDKLITFDSTPFRIDQKPKPGQDNERLIAESKSFAEGLKLDAVTLKRFLANCSKSRDAARAEGFRQHLGKELQMLLSTKNELRLLTLKYSKLKAAHQGCPRRSGRLQ